MPTLIDELIVALELDPKKFTEGQRAAVTSFKSTQDNATKSAKDIEAQGKKAAEFFGSIRRQALGLFAVLSAGRGLKDFTADITRGDAATGMLSKNIGMATNELGAWQRMANQAGGSAESMTSALANVSAMGERVKLLGTAGGDNDNWLRSLGIGPQDLQDSGVAMLKMADAAKALVDAGKGKEAQMKLSALGFDQNTINVLEQGRGALEAYLQEQRKIGGVTDESAAKAKKYRAEMSVFKDEIDEAGRTVGLVLLPPLTEFLKWVNGATQAAPGLATAIWGIVAAVTALANISMAKGVLGLLGLPGKGGAAAGAGEIVAGAGGAEAAAGAALAGKAAGATVTVTEVGALPAIVAPLAGFVASLIPTEANKGEDEAVARHRSVEQQAFSLIAEKEGFIDHAKIDNDGLYRAGYGSDTLTDPRTHAVSSVTKDTKGVTREMAQADLMRRITAISMPRAKKAAGAGWDKLNAATQAALTSVAYNYRHYPESVARASQTGDAVLISEAIRARAVDNKGINARRRISEANSVMASLPRSGAGLAAGAGAAPQGSSSTEINVGQVTVVTQATDARGIARDIAPALKSQLHAVQANSGVS